jgi:hypothetical protein
MLHYQKSLSLGEAIFLGLPNDVYGNLQCTRTNQAKNRQKFIRKQYLLRPNPLRRALVTDGRILVFPNPL